MVNGRKLASDLKFYTDYAKWIEDEGRAENWEDSVKRVMDMHRHKYAKQISKNPELERAINFAERAYLEKNILGSQRALQWADGPGVEGPNQEASRPLTRPGRRPGPHLLSPRVAGDCESSWRDERIERTRLRSA